MPTPQQRPTKAGSRRKPDAQPAPPEEVRILAYEIYETRRDTGTLGDPESDWLEAERRLRAKPARSSRRRASKT